MTCCLRIFPKIFIILACGDNVLDIAIDIYWSLLCYGEALFMSRNNSSDSNQIVLWQIRRETETGRLGNFRCCEQGVRMTKLVKTSFLTPCCEQHSEHPLKQSTLIRASWQEILFAACVLCNELPFLRFIVTMMIVCTTLWMHSLANQLIKIKKLLKNGYYYHNFKQIFLLSVCSHINQKDPLQWSSKK